MERKKLFLFSIFLLVFVETNGLAPPECDYCIYPPCKPTVLPEPNFDAKEDMKKIKAAMTSRNEETIIQILTSRSDSQRMAIALEYIATGETLIDTISNQFQASRMLWIALLTPLPMFYVEEIREAMQYSKSVEKIEILFEIFTSLPNCAIREILYYYRLITGEPLSNKIGSSWFWGVTSFLRALILGNRDENIQMNDENIANANNDAKTLAELVSSLGSTSISNMVGITKNKLNNLFITIFTAKSFPYIKKVLEFYDVHRKKQFPDYQSIFKDFEKIYDEEMQKATSVAITNALNPNIFFAQQLDWYLTRFSVAIEKGYETKTDERAIIRILRARCEVDLEDIKTRFPTSYKIPLARRIRTDVSDGYKKPLLALIKE